jgi:glycosyltransferase involved in cell wall biosynthesis
MPTKVLDLDLSEKIASVSVGEGNDSLYILVRYCKQPIGWVWISIPNPDVSVISAEHLQQEIMQQLGKKLMQKLLGRQLGTHSDRQISLEPISIIVCTRNRTQYLKHCLQALLELDYPNYEIIVVDNAPSNDDTFQLAQQLPVRYVREDRPGLDWARNRGIAEARYNIVAFTDDDAQVDRYWLNAINHAFAEPEVMAVTGYVAPAELETNAQCLFEFDYGGMGHGFQRRVIQRNHLSDRDLLWASSFGVGVNMAFRREVFAQIGPFDVALDVGTPSHGAGDVEMFHRLVAQGYTLVYEPSMLVWHTHRRHRAALHQQIYDNGRSFGCYLLTCWHKHKFKPSSILKFFLYNWLGLWVIRNLIRPPRKLPRYFALIELFGMLTSPFAYRATQACAKQVAATYPEPMNQRELEEAVQ